MDSPITTGFDTVENTQIAAVDQLPSYSHEIRNDEYMKIRDYIYNIYT